MLSSKNIVKFVRHAGFRSKLLQNPVIPSNFPRYYQSLKECNSHTTICAFDMNTMQICRGYAKGKDKKKEKGKAKVVVNETILAELMNVETLKNLMQKAVEQLKEDLIRHVSLRSSTGSIEMLTINFDGNEHTLQELAQIGRTNPKVIVVNMSVFPQAIPSVLKAIEKSGMNLNPQQDGTTLFIPVPKVTKEHRETLSKTAKQYFVKCRDAIKDVQNKYTKQIKKKDGLSEDLARNVEAQLASIAEGYISQADTIFVSKQNELIGKD